MNYITTLINHGSYGGLPPTGIFIFWIIVSLVSLVGYGLYLTLGPGGKDLKDEIKEHARMHEMGIAHGHEGGSAVIMDASKDYPKHKHDN